MMYGLAFATLLPVELRARKPCMPNVEGSTFTAVCHPLLIDAHGQLIPDAKMNITDVNTNTTNTASRSFISNERVIAKNTHAST